MEESVLHDAENKFGVLILLLILDNCIKLMAFVQAIYIPIFTNEAGFT
jgi:hypothetical protein